ncbi:MAG: hypothetical protein M1411_02790 [Candidatus Thermoplasmatota archaeon]|jgi:hypothetical protein|nr:hypothetical protein [Candidatus Thermoplasmatota archaeon]
MNKNNKVQGDYINMKMKKRNITYIYRCPKCNSTDLYYEAGMIIGHVYHCKNCDYIGTLVFEERVMNKDKDKSDSKE